jgi:biotin carboxyl carrier protein
MLLDDRSDEDGSRCTSGTRGRIAEVLVQPGQKIDAKDLLVVFKAG